MRAHNSDKNNWSGNSRPYAQIGSYEAPLKYPKKLGQDLNGQNDGRANGTTVRLHNTIFQGHTNQM